MSHQRTTPTDRDTPDAGGAPATKGQAHVLVLGPMRSGTTLISDLLTLRGQSFIVSEPDFFQAWPRLSMERIVNAADAFGLDTGVGTPPKQGFDTFQNWFDRVLLPQLEGLDFWGIKQVRLYDWQRLIRDYQPRNILLCVRDLRDIVLSAFDLIPRHRMAFPGGQHMRDEAWVLTSLCHDIHELLAIAERYPHVLVPYESLVAGDRFREDLRRRLGLARFSDERINLLAEKDNSRAWEADKHGGAFTARSVGRAEREPWGPGRAMAERTHNVLWRYGERFGYGESEGPRVIHPMAEPRSTGGNPVPDWQATTWDWNGPQLIEPAFARRRARQWVADRVSPETTVLELGCCVPALRHLLPEGCLYLGSDVISRYEGCLVADYNRRELPGEAEGVDLICALGLLEYLDDLPGFLKRLAAVGRPLMVSYHPLDDAPGLDRAALGWRNHLTRRDLLQAFRAAGLRWRAEWVLDGHQGLFHLSAPAP